jgi:hypothetical protein
MAGYLSPRAGQRPTRAGQRPVRPGVVAYECLAGRRPFTGEHPIAVALGHLPPPLPDDVPGEVRELARPGCFTLDEPASARTGPRRRIHPGHIHRQLRWGGDGVTVRPPDPRHGDPHNESVPVETIFLEWLEGVDPDARH